MFISTTNNILYNMLILHNIDIVSNSAWYLWILLSIYFVDVQWKLRLLRLQNFWKVHNTLYVYVSVVFLDLL